MPISVSLVEDDREISESLAVLINGTPGFRCLNCYRTSEEALEKIPADKPDVVLMDINLPGMSGIECARNLKTQFPNLRIVMLTMYEDGDQIFKSLIAGASGYLLKRTSPAKIMEAIQEVHDGGAPMSRQIARKVVHYFHNFPAPAAEVAQLTPREHDILDGLAKGYLYKEIADSLGISTDTVRGHIRNIYDKLHVHSRTEAVVKFLGR